jgi:hypothetical protein
MTMPLVYLGTGWFIGIALASALSLPLEFLLTQAFTLLASADADDGRLAWAADRA